MSGEEEQFQSNIAGLVKNVLMITLEKLEIIVT